MTIPNVDSTTLNDLVPNLDVGDVADPALRLASFQYIYTKLQEVVAEINSLPTGNIQNLAITTAKLADLAITTGKITDLSVTTAKLNDLSVTLAKMAANSVGSSQLVDLSVTASKIANGVLTASKFVPGALTNDTTNALRITDVESDMRQREINFCSVPYYADPTGATDSYAAIQAALDDAYVGSAVYGPIGTFMISQTLQIPSTVTLILNDSCVIKRGASMTAMIINKSDGTKGGYTAGERIKIMGGILDGNIISYPGACTGIGIGHTNDVLIKGVKFINIPVWHMLEINASKNVRVERCIFENNLGDGTTEMIQIDLALNSSVFPWFGPYDETLCYDITIEGCSFLNGVDGIGTHSAKLDTNQSYIRMINNKFENMSGAGIKTLNYSDVVITGNEFVSCQRGIFASIQASVSNRYMIANNTFTGMAQRAIQIGADVRDGVIQGNTVSLCGTHGIGIDLSQNWIIEGNNVQGCSQSGIWSYASQNVSIINNIAVGNNLTAATDRFDINVGFFVTTKNQYNKVIGNHVGNIGIDNTINAVVTNNTITGAFTNKSDNTNLKSFNNFIAGTWTA